MLLLEADTADQVWLDAAERFQSGRGTSRQASRGGDTHELLHVAMVVRRPRERWVLSRRPPINPAFALAEVVWIFSGRDDAGFLNFWNPALPRFAGKAPTYYGAYGHRLRFRFGLDQVRCAYEALQGCPDSRQVVLQIWDARADLPIDHGKARGEDIPCNVCSVLKLRGGRLEWLQVMRSNDLKLGWPHNVVQFTMLQELMAGWLKCEVGEYTHLSDSLHLYERDQVELIELPTVSVAPNADRWSMSFDDSAAAFDHIGAQMDQMRHQDATDQRIELAASAAGLPESAANALAIIGADAARRHGFDSLSQILASRCTNPVLQQAWTRWLQRQTARDGRPESAV